MASQEEFSQPTQKAFDSRRAGKQNSGFSDQDIADIICLLVPISEHARELVSKLSKESSKYTIGRNLAEQAKWDYDKEDDSRNFTSMPFDMGEHAIVLRLSAKVKNPLHGFTFGRNKTRCDICFENDPFRRLSNVHFRIYFNEYGVLLLEDQSTNGTVVDDKLLKSNSAHVKRTLNSGATIKILMHQENLDLHFLVRIPRRDDDLEEAYHKNLIRYMEGLRLLKEDIDTTITAGPGGHVDLFPASRRTDRGRNVIARDTNNTDDFTRESTNLRVRGVPRTWNGSDRYNRVGEIGRGAFATVYKVTSKFDGNPYAAKELDKRKFMKNGVLDQKVENEMKIMQKIRHPNIVQYIEHLDWDNRLLIIIMEYVPGGDLGKLISERGRLSEPATVVMAKQLLDALGYLHDKNITHRDVKPDNILINSQHPFVVKLTDFGLSKMIDNDETFLRTFCGTLLYCAPEVYSEYTEYDDFGRRNPRNRQRHATTGQRYDHAVDVWSLGGVLFYALTGLPPFPVKAGISYSELLHHIMTRPLDVTPLRRANVSEDGIDFLCSMLNRRPESRATVHDLLQHRWLGGPGAAPPHPSQELERLSLEDKENQEMIPTAAELLVEQSDDEILDEFQDEEKENDESMVDTSQFESEKENYTFGPGRYPQTRLFGEVNVSAVGSSGVIPSRLNLQLSDASLGSTEILDDSQRSEIGDSFDSESSTPRQPSGKGQQQSSGTGLRVSVLSSQQTRSDPSLSNQAPDAASQSLGGAESRLGHLNMKSLAGSHLHPRGSDLNTSKRKTSYDTSDEFGSSSTSGRPTIKRLRSEVIDDSNTDCSSEDGDFELYAHIPAVARRNSGRQIDHPVHKAAYWLAEDVKSWHLDYPEMTQLQLDAFEAAAVARGEKFGPKSALWELALKYFPADHYREVLTQKELATSHGSIELGGREGIASPSSSDIPQTARPGSWEDEEQAEPNSLVDTQPPADVGLIVPVQSEPEKRVVACFESSPDSKVPGISVFVTEPLVTWGRHPDNTQVYTPKSEARVPKYGFKLMLWKERHEPWKDWRPWLHGRRPDENAFHFYISTKATNGIYVNSVVLPSHDPKNPQSPPKHWIRLHDGDSVDVWVNTPGDPIDRTRLLFRCSWGGSAMPRPANSRTELVPQNVALLLDDACHRIDKKMPELIEHAHKMEEATADATERKLHRADRERERSRLFEIRRAEAMRVLALRGGGARRSASVSSVPALAGQAKKGWVVPDTELPHTTPAPRVRSEWDD